MSYIVYILECADKTLYTGSTNDLPKRLAQHNSDTSRTKYTRGRRPVKVVYMETVMNVSEARKREGGIKKMTREEKLLLIKK